ncbi:MAG TPA: hypothetical protein P5056_01945 [Candidatus Paceibacterota bacterium]|nr:hypothetical protein [Candidatus Paceibacterota bacterium]
MNLSDPHNGARLSLWITIIIFICFAVGGMGACMMDSSDKYLLIKKEDYDKFAESYKTLERAYDAIIKEANVLREERDALLKRVEELEAELAKEKSKTTGEVLDHKAHICFRCYQNLDTSLTKDEMAVEENLLLERARIMKFTRWRLNILPKIFEVK